MPSCTPLPSVPRLPSGCHMPRGATAPFLPGAILFGSQGFTFNNYISDSQFCSPALTSSPKATLRILLLYPKLDRFKTDSSGFTPDRPLPPPCFPSFSRTHYSWSYSSQKPKSHPGFLPHPYQTHWRRSCLVCLPRGALPTAQPHLIRAPGTFCWPMGSQLPTGPHHFLLKIQMLPLGLQDPP